MGDQGPNHRCSPNVLLTISVLVQGLRYGLGNTVEPCGENTLKTNYCSLYVQVPESCVVPYSSVHTYIHVYILLYPHTKNFR